MYQNKYLHTSTLNHTQYTNTIIHIIQSTISMSEDVMSENEKVEITEYDRTIPLGVNQVLIFS